MCEKKKSFPDFFTSKISALPHFLLETFDSLGKWASEVPRVTVSAECLQSPTPGDTSLPSHMAARPHKSHTHLLPCSLDQLHASNKESRRKERFVSISPPPPRPLLPSLPASTCSQL